MNTNAIHDLIAELYYIIELLEDGNLEEAKEELQGQAGTITTILEETK